MMFSRGAVLDGRVDGASTAFKRGIEYDASAKTCARARGAQAGAKAGAKLELKAFARLSVLVDGARTPAGETHSLLFFLTQRRASQRRLSHKN